MKQISKWKLNFLMLIFENVVKKHYITRKKINVFIAMNVNLIIFKSRILKAKNIALDAPQIAYNV
jgi:hypothetical protein